MTAPFWMATVAGAFLALFSVIVAATRARCSSPHYAPAQAIIGIGLVATFGPLAINDESTASRVVMLTGNALMLLGAVLFLIKASSTRRR